MRRLLAVLFALIVAFMAGPASAMQFALLQTSDGQHPLLASGEIKPGDARRLIAALQRVSRDKQGTKEIYLDSPGGTVADALEMAQVMAQVGVSTIVPAKAICASACASVMFVAGKYRTVQKGGRLLIHSCYDARTGGKIDYCDAVISALAQKRGISGRAMMAFQEIAPGPDSGVLFDAADAACFGLTRAPGKAELGDNAPCIQKILHSGRKKKK